MKNTICGMTIVELQNVLTKYGFDHKHCRKILLGVYRKGITDLSKISDIPGNLKSLMISEFEPGVYSPLKSETSADKTVKYLFRNELGLEYETVLIPDARRNTVCVSTQAGCRMGCTFCQTGKSGFTGSLSAQDIVNQVVNFLNSGNLTHVVFMGMGEPMDNLGEVLSACQILTSDWGLAFSPRNITVSSVGITPAIKEFLDSSECNLTVSLYSPFTGERAEVVPAEKVYPVKDIIDRMKSFPLTKKRRFSMAYVMIENVNDSDSHLEELKRLLTGTSIRVNLLPYHRIANDTKQSSSPAKMAFFKHSLVTSGVSASIRKSRGADISAACGLLASGSKRKRL